MRIIKFKAFDIITQTWKDDVITDGECIIDLYYHDDGEFITESYSYNSDVHIVQFIGEKDLNNVEIYEGDIVRGDDALSRDDPAHNAGYWPTGIVVYENASFIIQSEDTDWAQAFRVPIDWSEVEIIGNKFENEDLI